MLVQTIVDEFNAYFEQNPDHDTILWFDPQGKWRGLLPYLTSRLPLLIFEGSQLRLRYESARRGPGECKYIVMGGEMTRKIFRTGNSTVVSLPVDVLEVVGSPQSSHRQVSDVAAVKRQLIPSAFQSLCWQKSASVR